MAQPAPLKRATVDAKVAVSALVCPVFTCRYDSSTSEEMLIVTAWRS